MRRFRTGSDETVARLQPDFANNATFAISVFRRAGELARVDSTARLFAYFNERVRGNRHAVEAALIDARPCDMAAILSKASAELRADREVVRFALGNASSGGNEYVQMVKNEMAPELQNDKDWIKSILGGAPRRSASCAGSKGHDSRYDGPRRRQLFQTPRPTS